MAVEQASTNLLILRTLCIIKLNNGSNSWMILALRHIFSWSRMNINLEANYLSLVWTLAWTELQMLSENIQCNCKYCTVWRLFPLPSVQDEYSNWIITKRSARMNIEKSQDECSRKYKGGKVARMNSWNSRQVQIAVKCNYSVKKLLRNPRSQQPAKAFAKWWWWLMVQ